MSVVGCYRRFPARRGRPRNHGEHGSGLGEVVEDLVYAAVPELLVAVDASGIDAQQDRDAVASPPGDLRGRDTSVEAERDTAVPQVIRASR